MMKTLPLLLLLVVCMEYDSVVAERVSVHRHHSRERRYLVFPRGTGNKLQVICGFGVPVDVPRTSLTYGLILKSNYQLPTNATQFTDPYVAFASRGVAASRWHLYRVAEALLTRLGLGGRSCLLRSVCEAAQDPLPHNDILAELLHVLLTPTSTEDAALDESAVDYYAAERRGRELGRNSSHYTADCSALYPHCGTSLLDLVSTLASDTVSRLL